MEPVVTEDEETGGEPVNGRTPNRSPRRLRPLPEETPVTKRVKTRDGRSKKKRTRKTTLDPQNYESPEVKGQLEKLRGDESRTGKKQMKNSKKEKRNDAVMGSRPSGASSDTMNQADDQLSVDLIQYEDFEYPFENIVFEGGGNKGLAYAGAIRVSFERYC